MSSPTPVDIIEDSPGIKKATGAVFGGLGGAVGGLLGSLTGGVMVKWAKRAGEAVANSFPNWPRLGAAFGVVAGGIAGFVGAPFSPIGWLAGIGQGIYRGYRAATAYGGSSKISSVNIIGQVLAGIEGGASAVHSDMGKAGEAETAFIERRNKSGYGRLALKGFLGTTFGLVGGAGGAIGGAVASPFLAIGYIYKGLKEITGGGPGTAFLALLGAAGLFVMGKGVGLGATVVGGGVAGAGFAGAVSGKFGVDIAENISNSADEKWEGLWKKIGEKWDGLFKKKENKKEATTPDVSHAKKPAAEKKEEITPSRRESLIQERKEGERTRSDTVVDTSTPGKSPTERLVNATGRLTTNAVSATPHGPDSSSSTSTPLRTIKDTTQPSSESVALEVKATQEAFSRTFDILKNYSEKRAEKPELPPVTIRNVQVIAGDATAPKAFSAEIVRTKDTGHADKLVQTFKAGESGATGGSIVSRLSPPQGKLPSDDSIMMMLNLHKGSKQLTVRCKNPENALRMIEAAKIIGVPLKIRDEDMIAVNEKAKTDPGFKFRLESIQSATAEQLKDLKNTYPERNLGEPLTRPPKPAAKTGPP